MKRAILLAAVLTFSGCEPEIPKNLSQNLDGPSEARELCAWLRANNAIDKDSNVDWYAVRTTSGSLRIQGSCGSTPILDLMFREVSANKTRDLKISLRQDSPKGGNLVYRNLETSGWSSRYETTARTEITEVEVAENGTNELTISFRSSGRLRKDYGSSTVVPSEYKLSFEGKVDLYLRGEKSAIFTQSSFGDYDYGGSYELNFKLEQ